MTTKTELETAKEWWTTLSIEQRESLMCYVPKTIKPREAVLHIFRKEVIEPFSKGKYDGGFYDDEMRFAIYQEEVLKNTAYFESPVNPIYSDSEVMDKQLEIEECRFIGDCKLLCLTSCLKFPNDKNISLINKGNNIQSADNDLIGKLKEAKEVIEALNSAIDLYWNNYNKPFPESEVIFAQRQCLKFLESLTTLADKQDLK